MKKILLYAIILIGSIGIAGGQSTLIRANSDKADIRDGLHFKKGAWTIAPGSAVNRYYIEIPNKEHRVSFYTDVDSIRFDISPGGVYNFAILLNNKDTCFTQLVAAPEKTIKYISPHIDSNIPDTIPFTLSNNNKVYLKGSINHSDSLNILFDLGSAGMIVKNTSFKTSGNRLNIAGIQWDSLDATINADALGSREDGLVGNGLFQDKIVKIDYDSRQIIVYPALPETDTTFSRHEMILDGAVPLIQAGVATKDTTCMTWFLLATGNSGNSFIDQNTASVYNLYKGSNRFFSWDGKVFVKFPEVRVANLSFLNISATMAKAGKHMNDRSMLGNGLMKRFNMIIDNRNGFIYFKPNSLRKAQFDNTFLIIYGVISVAVIALLALILIIFRVYKRRKSNHLAVNIDSGSYNEASYR